ncbi:sigma-70 family RNA polymerase sigma factor, partial [Bacteroides acidifaciens]|uniref:sigma-70 family RNA polymerase sigma factor n=1 Tax=Bacteroides acidifaciens TaxID=85831 RepID=UPI0026188A9F
MNPYNDIGAQFEKLFDDNYRRLIFHALRFVDSQEEAEDIVSDVFYELWKKIDCLDLNSGITSYLYRAVSTRALNVIRHKNVAAVRIELLESINERRMEFVAEEDTQRDVESVEIGQKMRHAIDELPDRCRQVFILSYIN